MTTAMALPPGYIHNVIVYVESYEGYRSDIIERKEIIINGHITCQFCVEESRLSEQK